MTILCWFPVIWMQLNFSKLEVTDKRTPFSKPAAKSRAARVSSWRIVAFFKAPYTRCERLSLIARRICHYVQLSH